MDHEDRRQKLVETATEVFLRYGYRKTTVDDVAEAAGLQKSSLYHYFDNKDELFREVVLHVHSGLMEKFVAVVPGNAPLLHELDAFVSVLRDELTRIQPHLEFLFDDLTSILPVAGGILNDFVARVHELIAHRVQRAVSEGELRVCPVDDLVTILLMFLMRVFKARGFSIQHAVAADNATHYVRVLFAPYFTKPLDAA